MKKRILTVFLVIVCITCVFATGCKTETQIENLYGDYEKELNSLAKEFEDCCDKAKVSLKNSTASEMDAIYHNLYNKYDAYEYKIDNLSAEYYGKLCETIYNAPNTESFYKSDTHKTIDECGNKNARPNAISKISKAWYEFLEDYQAARY